MADPIQRLLNGTSAFVQKEQQHAQSALLFRTEPLSESMRLLATGRYRVWFEPDWHHACTLARYFPHCTIYSIPHESNTENLHSTPGWRRKRQKRYVV